MQKPNKNNFTGGLLVGKKLHIPDKVNYAEFAIDNFLRFSDKVALIEGRTGHRITYKELVQKIVNTAASLSRLGVKKGNVVAVCSENRIDFMVTIYAIIYTGATATFINSSYSLDDLKHTTNISNPNYVVFSPTTYKKYYSVLKEKGNVKKFIVYGKTTESNCIDFEELSSRHTDINSFKPTALNTQTETAIIVYSSGTTGLPKGARWTHYNLIIAGLQEIPSSRPMISLTVAPWTNTVGFICTSDHMINGNTLVFLARFNEELYLQCIQKYRVTFLIGVPPIVVILSKSVILKNYDVSSIEIIFSGGAPLEANTIIGVKQRFKNLKYVLQGYGMTEGGIAEETEEINKLGSVGKVVAGLTIKVVDPETREILGPNQRGEVCLKGPPIFGGYIGKDLRDDYDSEGYYKTGDIAYYDEEGFVFVVDRIKELIKFKSWQVSPSELEAVLLQHPGVKDAAVVGRPDQLAGELPTAFVVRQPGTKATGKEIFDFVASKVSGWKQLKGGISFVTEIPKNGSGKILRRELKELLTKNPPCKL